MGNYPRQALGTHWRRRPGQLTPGRDLPQPPARPRSGRPTRRTIYRCGDSCLVDRATNETLNEDSDKASNTGAVELAVDLTDLTFKFSLGDLFGRVPLLEPTHDPGDLFIVRRWG